MVKNFNIRKSLKDKEIIPNKLKIFNILLKFYCTLINLWFMKRTFIKFYDCIYKYSQRRLAKLMKVPAFNITFNQFINSGALRDMVDKDGSGSKKGQLILQKASCLQQYYLL